MLQSVKTRFDHTLSVLGDECGEVQQVVSKINRFGIADVNPVSLNTNWTELRIEMHDLIAVYEMVCKECNEDSGIDRSLLQKKKDKVEKYMKYAVEIGTLK